jgi:hypothetical protein
MHHQYRLSLISERLEELSHSQSFNQDLAKSYIICSNNSFKPSSATKKTSHKPMASSRHQFCGDTVNTFGHEDQNFHWSREFSYYSTPTVENQVIWTFGIAHASCVPKVFYCKDLVSWCADKFIAKQRIIPLHDDSYVSLSPQVFHQMLKLLDPTLTFKGEDCKQFLENHNNRFGPLPPFFGKAESSY